jgi:hypothetical protein
VLKFWLLVATAAIDGSEELPVPDVAPGVEPVMGVGAAGDMESLQPTTVNARAATERYPAKFLMILSFTCPRLFPFKSAAAGTPADSSGFRSE